jgi:hypothetical protein
VSWVLVHRVIDSIVGLKPGAAGNRVQKDVSSSAAVTMTPAVETSSKQS